MPRKKKKSSVQTTVSCYLCGADGKPMDMSFLASPAIGHRVDFALNTTWLCREPCYKEARNSYLITQRIRQLQDRQYQENQANLEDALKETIATRPDPADLPDGLRVTEDDIELLASFEGDFSVETMQNERTIAAAFKLLRTYNQLPYYHCQNGVGVFWDYSELCTRLENLERGRAA